MCNGCGACCENIWSVPPEKVDTQKPETAAFLKKHWHPTGNRLANAAEYTCDVYDAKHKRCGAYNERPPVCRDFPWYNGEPVAWRLWRAPECEFWAEFFPIERPPGWKPKNPETVPVELRRKPTPIPAGLETRREPPGLPGRLADQR